jgi:hypothetical protein
LASRIPANRQAMHAPLSVPSAHPALTWKLPLPSQVITRVWHVPAAPSRRWLASHGAPRGVRVRQDTGCPRPGLPLLIANVKHARLGLRTRYPTEQLPAMQSHRHVLLADTQPPSLLRLAIVPVKCAKMARLPRVLGSARARHGAHVRLVKGCSLLALPLPTASACRALWAQPTRQL